MEVHSKRMYSSGVNLFSERQNSPKSIAERQSWRLRLYVGLECRGNDIPPRSHGHSLPEATLKEGAVPLESRSDPFAGWPQKGN